MSISMQKYLKSMQPSSLVGTLPLKRYLNALELKLAQLLRGIRPLFFRHNKIYQIIFFL